MALKHSQSRFLALLRQSSKQQQILQISVKQFSVFKTPSQKPTQQAKSEKTEEEQQKLLKKKEKEDSEKVLVEYLTKQSSKNNQIFSEQFFYGHQPNKFPKRKTETQQNLMDEEIEKQRNQVLGDEAYQQIKIKWLEKNIKRIPLFVASDEVLNTWYSLTNMKRLIVFTNTLYVGFSAMTLYSAKFAALSTLIYSCTGILTTMNLAFLLMFSKYAKNVVSNIDWDCVQEEFIICKPEGFFSVKQQEYSMNLLHMKMDAKQPQKNCLYYDSQSGMGFSTIGQGQWYNQQVFLYLLQKAKKLRDFSKAAQKNNNSQEEKQQ
eukprot:403347049